MPERPDARSNDERPWERFGRRDTLPHHGSLLRRVSEVGLALSYFLCCFPVPGLLLCGAVLLLAVWELGGIARGRLDLAGREDLDAATLNAFLGLLVGGTWLAGCIVVFPLLAR